MPGGKPGHSLFKGMGDRMDLRQLVALPLDQAIKELGMLDSYDRTEAMVHVMLSARSAAAR
jgi:hypothetical protein